MARPQKQGLEYFSLDVDMDQDDKVILIEARHGITGFAVIVKLLMKIYKEGYFYKWSEREQLLFSSKINVDINTVNEVVNDSIKWEIFNPELYKKYDVLTSRGIQKRYFEATKRRKELTLIEEYMLVDIPEPTDQLTITIINVDINKVVADKNEQGEELNHSIIPKEKKSKPNHSKPKETKLAYADNVLLTEKEYQALVDKHGEQNTKAMIDKLHFYKMSSGKTYKSDYGAINTWVAEKVLKHTQRLDKPGGVQNGYDRSNGVSREDAPRKSKIQPINKFTANL